MSAPRSTREPEWRSPAALIINGIGDHLIALPALRALASLMQGRLRLLCLPGARELFFSDLPLAAVHHPSALDHHAAPHAGDYANYATAELAAAIEDCDLFLCFDRHRSSSTTALLRALKPARSIGLLPGFDVEIPFHHTPHAMDLAFAIPMQLASDLRIEHFVAPPKLAEAATALARQLRRDLPPEAVLLAVHADSKPEKTWPAAKLGAALSKFLEHHRRAIAIMVGEEAFPVDVGASRGRLLRCHGIPLQAAFALIGMCDLFLGIDSCMLHLADLYRLPGVGLFGPTDPSEFGFRFARHLHVSAASMNDVSSTDVVDALEDLWTSVSPSH